MLPRAEQPGFIPIVVSDACGAGDEAAGERALASLRFAGDAFITDSDTFCASCGGLIQPPQRQAEAQVAEARPVEKAAALHALPCTFERDKDASMRLTLAVPLFGLHDRQIERVVEWYADREAIERELATILNGEPEWVALLEIVRVDFGGAGVRIERA